MSLARISNVSPWQIGQRQAVIAAEDTEWASKDGRPAARPRRRATGACGSRARPARRERTPGEATPCVPPSRTCDPHSRRSRTAAGGVPRSRPSDRASRGGGPSTGPPRPPNATRGECRGFVRSMR
jgi:hypothetical protein